LRGWKPALLSVTGIAKEGRGTWINLKQQHRWRVAQHDNHVHRLWVCFIGQGACRGLFHPFLHFPSSHLFKMVVGELQGRHGMEKPISSQIFPLALPKLSLVYNGDG
jgi:hypothetical protein